MRERIENLAALDVFASKFVRQFAGGATVFLQGELGAGKTTFVRSCVKFLAERAKLNVPRVTSPSFVIHQRYSLQPPVEHFDLYRLERAGEQELIEIGYFEAKARTEQSAGYLFVEWPSKVESPKELLQPTVELDIHIEDEGREIHCIGLREWSTAVAALRKDKT